MKTFRAVLLTTLAAAATCTAASAFEGKIDLLTTEGKKSFTTTYYYKGDKMRIESSESGEAGAVIFDFAAKQMMMIMPSEKMYMVMDIGGQMQSQNKKSDPPVKTGRTETILGYECEEYTLTEGKKVTQYWAAHGLGAFHAMMRGGPGGPPSGPSALEAATESDGVFPLRTVELSLKGKEISRTEATSVSTDSQPDSLFAPPKGYQSFSMGGMFGR